MPAKYLVRFDDICPTMNWRNWEPIEAALLELGIKPIVSVVPDNQDPRLCVDPPNDEFWARVRRWQELGWCIGLHGYQHVMKRSSAALLRIAPEGEFAGLSELDQAARIKAGLRILSQHGVSPALWVAPGHSFDRTTLRVLANEGLNVVSDGLGLFPYTDNLGVTWIPQQMWRLRRMPFGAWTACFHHNSWPPEEVTRFLQTLRRFQRDIVSLRETLDAYRGRAATAADCGIRLVFRTAIKAKQTFRSVLSVSR